MGQSSDGDAARMWRCLNANRNGVILTFSVAVIKKVVKRLYAVENKHFIEKSNLRKARDLVSAKHNFQL